MQKRHDVIFAGIGGMGVLMAGDILTRSAASQYKNVLWIPNYTSANRGAPCDCTVIMSDDDIYSPLLDQADTVVIMASSRFGAFENRVKPNGLLLCETLGLKNIEEKYDVSVVKMSVLETAAREGVALGANMITLGIYVAITNAIQENLVVNVLKEKFGARKKAMNGNIECFRKGLESGKKKLNQISTSTS